MANDEHLKILKQGMGAWNEWRKRNPEIKPDLSGAHLEKMSFLRADLSEANLKEAELSGARFIQADLTGANLSEANLSTADFNQTELINVDFSRAIVGWTNFGNVDLSEVHGLDSIRHLGPSNIGIFSIVRSEGKINEKFLRDVGIPDDIIIYLPSLVTTRHAIQFYSCFISYSHKDEEFAKRLHSRMRDANIRVWFAPEDIKGGEKLHEQIDRAIQIHDKLLIVLSENSLQSEWVMTEIHKARKTETREKRRKLFPIRLVNFDTLREWECFDADSGRDLAVEVREYFIPDFSYWKNHDAFEAAFEKLLKDLRAAEDHG